MDTLENYKRIVIKVGSALLVDGDDDGLRTSWLEALAREIAELKAQGKDVLVVSSGAIALGRIQLGLGERDIPLEQSQASAAIGQIRLAGAYSEALGRHNIKTAQILVTLDDSENRRRYLNLRITLNQLLRYGAVPIVNENDTIATDEIRYGDNDRMAAQIAVVVNADLLIIFSDIDGLYTQNPNDNPDAEHIPKILHINNEIENMAGESKSKFARGGMKTKILAAKTAIGAGCAMVIAKGTEKAALNRLRKGTRATWFIPRKDPQSARRDWISTMKPRGKIVIDNGAQNALLVGKSLLPAGIMSLSGVFGRGDMVEIIGLNGDIVARGLVRYNSSEGMKIKGKKSKEIKDILGYTARAAFIHRDDMVL